MNNEVKDPALGKIVEGNFKATAAPNEPTIHVRNTPHKGNPYKLAIIILSIVVFLLIAGIAYLLFCPLAKTNDNTTPSCPEPTECDCENVSDQEDKAVREVIVKLKDVLNNTIQNNNLTNYKVYQVYDAGYPIFQPENLEATIPLNKSYGVVIPVADTLTLTSEPTLYNLIYDYKLFQTIENTLINAGFTNTNKQYSTSSAGVPDTTFINFNTGIICSIGLLPSYNCGYKTWYNQSDAELSDTLTKVYETATNKTPTVLIAKTSEIKDSPISPYQTIDVAMQGFGASFYRTSPDAEWQYFAEGQSAPQCSQYNTEDLKKAFAGTSCFPDNTGPMETVQP